MRLRLKIKEKGASTFRLNCSQYLIILATLRAMHIQAVVIMTYTNNHLDRNGAVDGIDEGVFLRIKFKN